MEEINTNCGCSTIVSYKNCFCFFFRRSCGKENSEVTSRLGVVGGLVTKQRVRNDFWVIRYDCQFVGYTEVLSYVTSAFAPRCICSCALVCNKMFFFFYHQPEYSAVHNDWTSGQSDERELDATLCEYSPMKSLVKRGPDHSVFEWKGCGVVGLKGWKLVEKRYHFVYNSPTKKM